MTPADPVALLSAALAPDGLDLVIGLTATAEQFRAWNLNVEDGSHAALLVGNTRALWEPLTAEFAQSKALQQAEHPLERFVEARVLGAVGSLPHFAGATVVWVHRGPPYVAINQMGETAGFAHRSPVGLSVHPEYGLWFAWRAVVVLPHRAWGDAPRSPHRSPCDGCRAPCVAARAAALQLGPETEATVRAHPHAWIAIREACPYGTQHRYGAQQVMYHYTRDLRWLMAEPDAETWP